MPSRSIVRMTCVVSGSTCVSVPAMGFATQMPVEVTATSLTPGESSVAPTDSARPAPMRHSVPSAGRRDPGCVPADGDRSDRTGRDRCASYDPTRTLVEPDDRPVDPEHPDPRAAAGDRRRRHVANRLRDRARRRVGSNDREVRGNCPQRARRDREVVVDEVRGRASRSRKADLDPFRARRRIEARHRRRHRPDELRVRQAPAVRDPDRAGAERDVRRRRARCERLDDTRRRNDAKDRPRVRVHEPEGAVADRERGRRAPCRNAAARSHPTRRRSRRPIPWPTMRGRPGSVAVAEGESGESPR